MSDERLAGPELDRLIAEVIGLIVRQPEDDAGPEFVENTDHPFYERFLARATRIEHTGSLVPDFSTDCSVALLLLEDMNWMMRHSSKTQYDNYAVEILGFRLKVAGHGNTLALAICHAWLKLFILYPEWMQRKGE